MPSSVRSAWIAAVRSGGSALRYAASATIWMTPPFFASAFNWSSSRLRSFGDSALQPECDSMIGAFDVAMASQNDFAEACERSTIMPSRFISSHDLLPEFGQAVVHRLSPGVDESASWLCDPCTSVM